MKKLLLSLALCVAGLASAHAEDTAAEHYITRSGWQITPCSEIDEGGGNGYAVNMIDDDVNTYWHSNWSNDKATTSYHWFILDMGKSHQIDGFDYWRRQNNSNGQFLAGKAYVSDTVFTAFANHDAAKAYHDSEDNTAAAEFTFTYDENPNDVRRCSFTKPVTGRYLLVILSNSGANNVGKHACCGDFKVFTTEKITDVTAEYNDGIAAMKAKADAFALLNAAIGGEEAPSVAAPEDLTVDNLESAVSTANQALQAYINKFNDKQILIQCAYRRDKGYLSVIPGGNGVRINTLATAGPDAVWTIVTQSDGLRLYNRNTGYYIGTGNGPAALGNAQTLIPGVINTDYVKFAKGSSNNLLNVDNYSSNLTDWSDANDQGSSWIISAASYDYVQPEVSTADAPVWYRIVSARWMYSKSSPGLAVNGENQDGNGNGEIVTRCTANIPGIYWRLEAGTATDAVKLVNLTGYQLTNEGSNAVKMAAEGADYYVIKQTDEQFNGMTCFAISNTATMGGESCLDAGSNGQSKVCWSPTREDRGNGDNGSLWYFILASDSEVATATNAYINAVKGRFYVAAPDDNLAELFGEEFAATLAGKSIDKAALTTVADVNSAKAADHSADIKDIKDAVEAKISELAGNQYLITSGNPAHTNKYLCVQQAENVWTTTPVSNASDLNTVWTLEKSGDNFILRNKQGAIDYMTNNNNSAPIPLTTDGMPYQIAYEPRVPGFSFTLVPTESITDTSNYVIHNSNGTRVCSWRAADGNNPIAGSHWHLNLLDEASVEVSKGNAENHVLTLGEGITVNTHESAAELKATITKNVATFTLQPAEDGSYTLGVSDFDENGVADVKSLPEGEYTLSAPAGMFLVNGKPAGALTHVFSVNGDGTTTGIDEIAVNNNNGNVIYDLQGRRLAAPVKGINIINGKKVLVR